MPNPTKFSQPTRPKIISKTRRKPEGPSVSEPREVRLKCKQNEIGRAPFINAPRHHRSLSDEQVAFIQSAPAMALRKRFRAETYAHNAMMGRRHEGAIVHRDLATLRSFLLNVGLMPGRGMTVDRINNVDPEYAREKVRWADKHTQNNNKSDTLTFHSPRTGDVYTTSRLAKIQKVSKDAIRKRRREGWSDEEVIAGERPKSDRKPQPAKSSGYIPETVENAPKSSSVEKKVLWAIGQIWQQLVSMKCKNTELMPNWRTLSYSKEIILQIGFEKTSDLIHAVTSGWLLFGNYVKAHDGIREVPHHPNFEFVFRFHPQAALDFTLDETIRAGRLSDQRDRQLVADYRKAHGETASIPALNQLRHQERQRMNKLKQDLADKM